jgi:DNA polymerase-3 subunit alpha
MAKQKDKFVNGCIKGGMKPSVTNALWALIEPFAAYGFNKAHAASYGMVAYQTAYLKANYLCEFMTAVLTADAGDADRIAEAVGECGHLGIAVLPPDINESLLNFTYIDDTTVRFGLLAIKNLGEDIIRSIITEREKDGPYKSITDLANRVDSKNFNKKSMEALVKSGALDSLGERNQLLGSLDAILAHHKKASKDRAMGQDSLFAAIPLLSKVTHKTSEIALRDVSPATKREKLAWERELLGLYVSEHPYKEFAEYFDGALATVASLPTRRNQPGLVRLGGVIMELRKIVTKKGQPMAFAKVEDVSGTVEVVVFPSIYEQSPDLWVKDRLVMIEGKLQEREGELNVLCEKGQEITAENIEQLRNALTYADASSAGRNAARPARAVSLSAEVLCISVPPTLPKAFVTELQRIFSENPGTRRVFLVVNDGVQPQKRISTKFSISCDGDTIAAIEKVVGKGAVLA